VVPPEQRVPQAPQFALSVCSSTQAPPHTEKLAPAVQTHAPAVHCCAEAHCVLQPPQWSESEVVSTQAPEHAV
jgi:hypothetical protein